MLRNVMEEKDLFNGVKNLHVENLHDPELIAGLKMPFPNLESFSVNQFHKFACQLIEMEPYLRAFASLGLKCLEMELTEFIYDGKFSHFILFLRKLFQIGGSVSQVRRKLLLHSGRGRQFGSWEIFYNLCARENVPRLFSILRNVFENILYFKKILE